MKGRLQSPGGRSGLAVGLAAGIAALALAATSGPEERARAAKAPAERPNVVAVMTDDQTVESMRVMPKVQAKLGAKGITFENSLTNWPLCCPSRATFLTGQYAHNHGVLGNQPPQGGFDRLDSSETLPVWLQRAGYFTAHIGKYLNGYEGSAVGVPSGWSEWHGSKRTYTFYGYELLEGGQRVTYGSRDEDPDNPASPETYSTDVYTDKAVELIATRAPQRQPFFLSLAYLAPHSGGPNNPEGEPPTRCQGTAKPAVRHKGVFDAEPLPVPPSFNEADISDKPAGIRDREPLTTEQVDAAARRYRCRLESLLAIDEGVARIVDALNAAGELANTLIVFTSDNGFFHGEHRIRTGKNQVYEEAIRVPLLLRGPGVEKGRTVRDLVTNADLAPTILDAAGAEAGLAVDGRSLLPASRNPGRERGRELLIEQDRYAAVRTARYVYVEHTGGDSAGEVELYDLETDPFELQSQHANPAYATVRAALAARLAALRGCAAKACRIKPAVNLKLRGRERRGDRRRCRPAGQVTAAIRGKAAADVTEAAFRIAGRVVRRDASAPFADKLPKRKLRRKRKPEIQAIAELVDGRRISLQERARICR
ncbi:MAG: sulfatase family protein [Solirubrobacterales bacterium]